MILKGKEKADQIGNYDLNKKLFSGFSFSLVYPRLGAGEASNWQGHNKRRYNKSLPKGKGKGKPGKTEKISQ